MQWEPAVGFYRDRAGGPIKTHDTKQGSASEKGNIIKLFDERGL